MCASGKNIRVEAFSLIMSGTEFPTCPTAHTKLLWVSSHPFGWPVVPEVYTKVANASPSTISDRAITSSSLMSLPSSMSFSMPPSSRVKTCWLDSCFAAISLKVASCAEDDITVATDSELPTIQST